MSQVHHIAQRVAAFLQKQSAAFCENCLIERLQIASRLGMKAALESEGFSTRIGVCPDCKTRKQVISHRSQRVAASSSQRVATSKSKAA